ncbi:hypothetical protein AEX15_18980 [Salmonella enterica subsp. enterica serovar Kentucky]|nr:hypothetical protein AEX15_18980 [Salmonella enterica subsp. enterica serovar Kentucky]
MMENPIYIIKVQKIPVWASQANHLATLYKGFEGQWNENVRLWYNLLIIIQYTKVPFQGPFRML